MKNKTLTSVLAMASIALATACKKDEDKVKQAEGSKVEKEPQEQLYLQAVSPDKPLLVVYGDSLATGVLANTEFGQNIDSRLLEQIGGYVQQGKYNTANFQSSLANQDLAAATTDKDYGLRAAIGARTGVPAQEVGVISFARFGGKANDIPGMISRWEVEEANTAKKKPDYILVQLGGNDFCSDRTVELIASTYKEQLNAIKATAPDATLIIAPAPPAPSLVNIDFTYNSSIRKITGQELSCKTFREQACKRLYEADAADRMQAINKAIEEAYEEQIAAGAKAVYAGSVATWPLTSDDLSLDCFHPSELGQQHLGAYLKEALDTLP